MLKKLLLTIPLLLLLLVTGALGVFTYFFYNFEPEVVETMVDDADLSYFPEDYEDSRERFLQKAEELRENIPGGEAIQLKVSSEVDDDLTVDGLYLPAQVSQERLLIITSGLHGVEGYAGSAVAMMFMEELLVERDLSTTGYLFLHAVNPYGFKYNRRVTENNVDMNRNASVDESLYRLDNKGYREVDVLINPEGKADLSSWEHRLFHLRALSMILQHSMDSLRQAILQGQYHHDQGVFFGGYELEPQLRELKPLISENINSYSVVMNIDLHTGYGERGTLHLLQEPVDDPKVKETLEMVFGDHPIDWTDSDDFYQVTGDFVGFVGELMEEGLYLSMVFEYGTMDSQTTIGSLHSLHRMVLENQGYFYGYADPNVEARVKKSYMELYYPSSEEWRSKIISDSRNLFHVLLPNFENLVYY